MLVKAIRKGFFDAVREEGVTFEVPEGITGSWFEPFEAEKVKQPVAINDSTDAKQNKPTAK